MCCSGTLFYIRLVIEDLVVRVWINACLRRLFTRSPHHQLLSDVPAIAVSSIEQNPYKLVKQPLWLWICVTLHRLWPSRRLQLLAWPQNAAMPTRMTRERPGEPASGVSWLAGCPSATVPRKTSRVPTLRTSPSDGARLRQYSSVPHETDYAECSWYQ